MYVKIHFGANEVDGLLFTFVTRIDFWSLWFSTTRTDLFDNVVDPHNVATLTSQCLLVLYGSSA